MSEQKTEKDDNAAAAPKRRNRGFWRGGRRQRNRSRGALPGSPPGAGGRLIDLRGPRLY